MTLHRSLPFGLALLLLFAAIIAYSHKRAGALSPAPPPPLPKVQFAPDLQRAALWDARPSVPFVALDSPPMKQASQADFLVDSEYVLGLTERGESRAYPIRFLWFHHVINDTIGKPEQGVLPIALTYCIVCNSGICYDPRVNGKPLKFDFYGLYNGTAALCERETEGVLPLTEGRIVTGPLTGTHLASYPSLDTTWGQWKKLHPDTLVMSPDTLYRRNYFLSESLQPRGMTHFPMPYFEPTVTRSDTRLPAFTLSLAVTLARLGAAPLHRAYPLKTLGQAGGVVNDTLGGEPVGVLMDPGTITAVAVSRRLGNRTLTLLRRKQAGSGIAFFDRETGTRWNIEGHAEKGPLAGQTLPHLDNHLSQWYGWSASFPDTDIYIPAPRHARLPGAL